VSRQQIVDVLKKKLTEYKKDWNLYAREVLGVRLDSKQQNILSDIQVHNRVSVRSGVAIGKDYVSAVASICFLNLYNPSKVILTAPTSRQILSIMMPEVSKIYGNVKDQRFIAGIPLTNKIKFERNPDRFLLGFKAQANNIEVWSGHHSPNLMVVVTEASGLEDLIFDSIEGILTGGNGKLVVIFNPNRVSGFAYRSTLDHKFIRHKLSGLDAENVINKKIIYPGQVDYDWVADKVERWCYKIPAIQEDGDFQFNGSFYRANDLFRVKVLALFPKEDETALYKMDWISASNQVWKEIQDDPNRLCEKMKKPLLLGVDVAGMGTNETVFCERYDNYVHRFERFGKLNTMQIVQRIVEKMKKPDDIAFIDTIGEGAGVYARCKELIDLNQMKGKVVSAKASNGATGYRDITNQRQFLNMRAYAYWAIRDNLNPENFRNNQNGMIILPPDDRLEEELFATSRKDRSDNKIQIIEKEQIKNIIKRSPDTLESLHLTFYKPKRVDFSSLWGIGHRAN